MPRGIPKAGKRASGAGKPRKYGEKTKAVKAPLSIADNIADVYYFLIELEGEIAAWEESLELVDVAKNPRYDKASVLVKDIRGMLDGMGLDISQMGGYESIDSIDIDNPEQ
ncbi:hypothetical protein [Nostoc sp.]|uniref:hypothetical protein n=1 Tax=Nostoc sp. TaxID=1180 RepID=UPI002FFB4768